MPIERRRVVISGLVQGVAFRYYTRSAARQAGVFGWVKNLPDGRVEAVFEGDCDKVASMVQWCYRGSPHSRVDDVTVFTEKPSGEFSDFDITLGGGYW